MKQKQQQQKTIHGIKQIQRKREKTQSNTIRDKKKEQGHQGNSNNHKDTLYDTKIQVTHNSFLIKFPLYMTEITPDTEKLVTYPELVKSQSLEENLQVPFAKLE